MAEQVGPRALWRQLRREAPQWAALLPQVPRLAHQALSAAGARDGAKSEALERALRAQNRILRLIAVLFAGVLLLLLLQALV
jgi:ubiquinone biosynthesis protein